ncbi:hypothetical protein ACUXAV_006475 [Cupriavidus metallidurans]|uniref:hypothetical protein n=1 Tax=Cupriavidus TaxID=106589 RepID=UPI0002E33A64|nr:MULTISPECIES: hypothetical protein [Cupriavidus]KAB0597095.1 hypothetical protein F7R19_26915 [Cupriavidus pauculus]MCA3193851.1 hypothetical protein [Cupriavidus sp.]MCA3198280.1 hypothetical protein [Cupriavidus sp.]MCA3232262.1 hypothetical protein [Cupriavidus sp.]MDE4922758.1 hypothetical protein [Cupriavidus metallidurans]
MPLSRTAQMFVNLARERDRADLQHPYVECAGHGGQTERHPHTGAARAAKMEILTDEEYAVRLGVSHL